MRRVLGTATALVAVWVAGFVNAQSINSVPDNAVVIVKIKNLQDASTKLGTLFSDWGLVKTAPMLSDPLAALQGVSSIEKGLKADGEAVFYIANPAAQMQDGQPFVILVPVTDYAAFLGNFPDAETKGEITSITMPGEQQEPGFVAKWGNHAALSPSRTLVSARPQSTKVSGVAGDQFTGRDVVAYVNFDAFRNQAMGMMGFARGWAADQLDQALQGKPDAAQYAPLARVALNQAITGLEHFLNETKAITFGFDLARDGIQMTYLAEFKPDTYIGDMVKQWTVPQGSLTKGLPAGGYALVGGQALDTKVITQLIDDVTGPIVAEAKALEGEQGKAIAKLVVDYVDASRAYTAASPSASFALGASKNELGKGPLFEYLVVAHGDAKKALDAWSKMLATQNEFMKLFQVGAAEPMAAIKFKPNALNVDGVSFLETNTIAAADEGPEAELARKLYGSTSMKLYMGSVSDGALLVTTQSDNAELKTLIAASRSNQDPVAGQALSKEVTAKLPANPSIVMYAHADGILALASKASEAFAGSPLQMKVEGAAPFALSMSTQGTAIRYDAYVPSSMVKAVVQAVMAESTKPAGTKPAAELEQ